MEAREKYERRLALKESATQRVYGSALNKFLRVQGITLEGLMDMDPEDVGLLVQETMKAERDAGKKPSTAYMVYKAVRFFMRSIGRDFELQREDKPRLVYNGSRGVTKDEIRELWDVFNRGNLRLRNRAILLFMKDSGLRVSDVSLLDVGHYLGTKEITDRDDYPVQRGERFRAFEPLPTKKTGDYSHIVIGPESVKAIDEYLGDRRDGPLFLSEQGGRLTTKALSELFRTPRVKGKLSGNFNKVSAHSLRKYHYTKLQHIGEKLVHFLEGKANYTYEKPSEHDYIEAYVKNYDALRVFAQTENEINTLRNELNNLRQKVEAATLMNESPSISKLLLQIFEGMNPAEKAKYLEALRQGENPPES